MGSIHGVPGMWGVLATGFFHTTKGVFYGGEDSERVILWQFLGVIVIVAWVAVFALVCFVLLAMFEILRISEEAELAGYTAATNIPNPALSEIRQLVVDDA